MTQEEFSTSVLIENKQIKKQLVEYTGKFPAAGVGDRDKHNGRAAESDAVAVVPSALDCGILVPNEKVAMDGFAPGTRGAVLSRPALAPPSKPRSNPHGASGRRGRRGSGTGNGRGGGGLPIQTHQAQQSELDRAVLVPSGDQ